MRIENRLRNGERFLGSGTVIDVEDGYGLVITCKHLWEHGVGTATVMFPDGRQFEGRLLDADPKADLSALYIQAPEGTPWVRLAETPAQRGERLSKAGYPGGSGPVLAQGQFFRNGYIRETGTAVMEISLRSADGDSGGGIFRDTELVGVLWGGDDRVTTATNQDVVAAFLCRRCGDHFPRLKAWLAKIRGGGSVGVSVGTPPAKPNPVPIAPAPAAGDRAAVVAALQQINVNITNMQASIADLQNRPAGQPEAAGKDGANGIDGKPGRDGVDGKPGKDGVNGKDGKTPDTAALESRVTALEKAIKTVGGASSTVTYEPTKN